MRWRDPPPEHAFEPMETRANSNVTGDEGDVNWRQRRRTHCLEPRGVEYLRRLDIGHATCDGDEADLRDRGSANISSSVLTSVQRVRPPPLDVGTGACTLLATASAWSARVTVGSSQPQLAGHCRARTPASEDDASSIKPQRSAL